MLRKVAPPAKVDPLPELKAAIAEAPKDAFDIYKFGPPGFSGRGSILDRGERIVVKLSDGRVLNINRTYLEQEVRLVSFKPTTKDDYQCELLNNVRTSSKRSPRYEVVETITGPRAKELFDQSLARHALLDQQEKKQQVDKKNADEREVKLKVEGTLESIKTPQFIHALSQADVTVKWGKFSKIRTCGVKLPSGVYIALELKEEPLGEKGVKIIPEMKLIAQAGSSRFISDTYRGELVACIFAAAIEKFARESGEKPRRCERMRAQAEFALSGKPYKHESYHNESDLRRLAKLRANGVNI